MRIVKVDTSEIEQQYGYNDLTAVATYSSLPSFYIKLQGAITEFVIKKYFDETFIKEIPLDEGDIASDGTFLYFPSTSVDTSLASLMGSGGQYQYSFKVDGEEYKSSFRFAFKGIIFPRNIIFSTVIVNDVGGGNGSITDNAQRGYRSLNYCKDGGSTYQSSNIFSGLAAGDYPIKVKDSKGFESYTLPVTVGGVAVPLSFTATPTNETQPLEGDGTILVNGIGGTPPYEYAIDDTGYQVSSLLTGLVNGTYDVWIKDSLGAKYNDNVTVGSDAGNLTVAIHQEANYDIIWNKGHDLILSQTPTIGETITLSWNTFVKVFTWVASADASGTQLTATTDETILVADFIKNTDLNNDFIINNFASRVNFNKIEETFIGDGEPQKYDITPTFNGTTTIYANFNNDANEAIITLDITGGTPLYDYSINKGSSWVTMDAQNTITFYINQGNNHDIYIRDAFGNKGLIIVDLDVFTPIDVDLLKD